MNSPETYCIHFMFDCYDTRQLAMRVHVLGACEVLNMAVHYKETQCKTHIPKVALFYRGVETDVAEGLLSQVDIYDFIIESTAWSLFKICEEGR